MGFVKWNNFNGNLNPMIRPLSWQPIQMRVKLLGILRLFNNDVTNTPITSFIRLNLYQIIIPSHRALFDLTKLQMPLITNSTAGKVLKSIFFAIYQLKWQAFFNVMRARAPIEIVPLLQGPCMPRSHVICLPLIWQIYLIWKSIFPCCSYVHVIYMRYEISI